MEKETENKIRKALEVKEPVGERSINHMILLARTQWNGAVRRNRLTFSKLLLAQIRYIGWKMWIVELAAAIMPAFILLRFLGWHTITQATAVFLLCCLTVAISMLCVPFIYRSRYYRMWEIEAAAFFSIKKLLLARILLLSAGELAAIIGICIMTSKYTSFDYRNGLVCMLFLFGTAGNGMLLFVRKTETEKLCRYFLTYGFILILAMTLAARFLPHVFDGKYYSGIILGSCVLLGYGVYQSCLLAKQPEEITYA